MSSTNKTTNYNLSQFVGSDKPAWLSDYNQDMTKIDTGLKNAADTATGADGKADSNTTAIGDLTNLATTAKTSLVAAINEVDTNADAAAGVAETASTSANSALTKATALESALNLAPYDDYDSGFTVTAGNASISSGHIYVVKNTAGSLAKIYGNMTISSSSSSGSTTVKVTNDCGLYPSSDLTINNTGLNIQRVEGGSVENIRNISLTITTGGVLSITFTKASNRIHMLNLTACLLFIKDFGDTPE